MTSINLIIEIHKPVMLRKYSIFEIGENHNYFDKSKTKEIIKSNIEKSFLPLGEILLSKVNNSDFKFSFSVSGITLELFEKYAPEAIEILKKLSDTGKVNFIGETYHNSYASNYSSKEFIEQLNMHKEKIKNLFGKDTEIFKNTDYIYDNKIAKEIEKLGFKAIITEGIDRLYQHEPNYVYKAKDCDNVKVLMKNINFSDDIQIKFSDKGWNQWPLTTKEFCSWLNQSQNNSDIINIVLDNETFGIFNQKESGIFDFLSHLPDEFLKNPNNRFINNIDEINTLPIKNELDIDKPIAFLEKENEFSVITNKMQESAITDLFKIENKVKSTFDKDIINNWRMLSVSDHIHFMCTKRYNIGDKITYFNPYDTPYEGLIAYMNSLNDIISCTKEYESQKNTNFKGVSEIKGLN
ncbi:MAG: polysaccharide deacetylase family protein [Nanoarchaeota archaeon]